MYIKESSGTAITFHAKNELIQFEEHKNEMERSQHHIVRLKKWRNRLDITAFIANVSQILAGIIKFAISGKQSGNNSGPTYLKIPEIIDKFCKSWSMVLQTTSQFFAFIAFAACGLRALWDLGVTAYRWTFRTSAKKIINNHADDEKISLPSKHVLISRIAANIILATLNIIAVLTVIGLFMTGIGLALGVTAAAIGWVKDSVIPWYKVRKELAETEQELCDVNRAIQESTSKDKSELTKQRDTLQEQSIRLARENTSYRNSLLLGALSVVAFALFATGPFGLATLSMIGSILSIACISIGIGRLIYNACRRQSTSKNKENGEQDDLRIHTDNEVEFRHKHKLDRWMNSTHKMIKAKISNPVKINESTQPIIFSTPLKTSLSLAKTDCVNDDTSSIPDDSVINRRVTLRM